MKIKKTFWFICDKFRIWDMYKKIDSYFFHGAPRPMFESIKKSNMKDLVGVEIGTQKGINAYNILRLLPVKKLYLIDPYIYYNYKGQSNGAVDSDSLQNKFYKDAKETLSSYDDKIEFITKKSEEAIDNVPNNLDFVYIDGNHDYSYIKRDIEMYYPKVKKGGFFGGHDIHLNDVFKAVSEFKNKKDKKINIERVDWWFIK